MSRQAQPVISWLSKPRAYALASLLVIVPAGVYTKFYQGRAADWVNNSLGGVFYEIFWCLLVLVMVPSARTWVIALAVLLVTRMLELMQAGIGFVVNGVVIEKREGGILFKKLSATFVMLRRPPNYCQMADWDPLNGQEGTAELVAIFATLFLQPASMSANQRACEVVAVHRIITKRYHARDRQEDFLYVAVFYSCDHKTSG